MSSYPFFPWSDDEDSQPQAELGKTSASNFADEAESDQTIVSDNDFLDPVPLEYNWGSVLKAGIQVATPGFCKTCLELCSIRRTFSILSETPLVEPLVYSSLG